MKSIARSFAIEESKKKKDIKKKKKNVNKIKEENAKTKQMVDGMKDRREEKLKENEIELENEKLTVAKAEAFM